LSRPVVLVHGAWHGAWCWERVVPLLADAGVDATAVDLPSRVNAGFGLHEDADHVRAVLDGIGNDVVLLGHSYGGAVITDAGAHPTVGEVIYLCAFALDDGESCMAAAVEQSAAANISFEGRASVEDAFVVHDDGSATLEREGAIAGLYNRCDAATAGWAFDRLTPQPMATLGQSPRAVAWRERPSTYVVCDDDRAVHPDLQRILAKRCDRSLEWPTDHSPFLSAPKLVADLLIGLAQ
jgi:pimeloyl-ACP methyl ester carboxylesterase